MMECPDTSTRGKKLELELADKINYEIQKFYDDTYGAPALPKFIQKGRRRGNAAEHTLEALWMMYEYNRSTPFVDSVILGHMVHATASRLRREGFKPEIEPWEVFANLSKRRTFVEKLTNWSRYGKWE